MKNDTAEKLNRTREELFTTHQCRERSEPIQSHGFDIFNHFVIELFDTKTFEWKSHTNESNEPLDHKILMNFITKRALTLNAAESLNAKRNIETAQCVLCKERHNDDVQELPVKIRYQSHR